MSKYFSSGMNMVYLDQCAVSELIKENGDYAEVRKVIFAGHANRKFICPGSLEHLVETSAMSDGDALLADELTRKLSFGWSLVVEPRLIARQILCAMSSIKTTRAQFLHKGLFNPLSAPGALDALRDLKKKMDASNAWLMQGFNELNEHLRGGKKLGKDAHLILQNLQLQSVTKSLLKAVLTALASGRAEILAKEHQPTCRDWASTVVYTLVSEHRFRGPELEGLRNKLIKEKVSFIPTLVIMNALKAFQFYQREVIDPGDQYDITRIGCALPYADILITDGGKAHALRTLGLDAEFKAEVFSMKKKEIPALLNRLTALAA